MKTPLEASGSWRQFYEMAEGIVRGRRVLESDLLALLHYVDPQSFLPRSFFASIIGSFIGPGFIVGRKLLYYEGFEQFVKKNQREFDGAPLKVIKSFNQALHFLFGAKGSALSIPELYARDLTDHDLIFRRQMRRGSELDVISEAKPAQVPLQKSSIAPVPITPSTTAVEEEIKNLDTPYQAFLLAWAGKNQRDDQKKDQKFEPQLRAILHQLKKLLPPLQIEVEAEIAFMRNHYPDIAKSLSNLQLTPKFSLDTPDQLQLLLERNYQEVRSKLQSARELFQSRESARERIAKQIDGYVQLTERFKRYKDLHQPLATYIAELESEKITQQELSKVPSELIENYFLRKLGMVQQIERQSRTVFQELEAKRKAFENEAEEIVLMLQGRLYDIFSGEIPYLDQYEALISVQKYLDSKIAHISQEAMQGESSLPEFRKKIEHLAYDHDVLILREENAFRTKRLYDFRQAIWPYIHQCRLLEWLGEENLYPSFVDLMRRVCNPFEFFKGVTIREEINARFRDGWVVFEKLQEWLRRSGRNKSLPIHVKEQLKQLLEDINSLQIAHRNPLTESRLVAPETLEQLKECLQKIEQLYPWATPLALIAQIPTSHERRAFLEQGIQFHEKRQALITLGKEQQALKVHEIDRIDEIFQLFEVWDFGEMPEEISSQRKAILLRVQEALLFDAAFLDEIAVTAKSKTVLHESNAIATLFRHKLERLATTNRYAFMQCYLQKVILFINALEGELCKSLAFPEEQIKEADQIWYTPWLPECSQWRQRAAGLRVSYQLEEHIQDLLLEIEQVAQDVERGTSLAIKFQQLKAEFVLPAVNHPSDFFYPGFISGFLL